MRPRLLGMRGPCVARAFAARAVACAGAPRSRLSFRPTRARRPRRPPGGRHGRPSTRRGAVSRRAAPIVPSRTGRVDLPSVDHGTRLDNVLEVPADYVPDTQRGRCASRCTAAWDVPPRVRATNRPRPLDQPHSGRAGAGPASAGVGAVRVVDGGPGGERPDAGGHGQAPLQRGRIPRLSDRHLRRRHRRLLLRDARRQRPGPRACRSTAIRASWPIPTWAPTGSCIPPTWPTARCASSTAAATGCIRRRRSRRSSRCSSAAASRWTSRCTRRRGTTPAGGRRSGPSTRRSWPATARQPHPARVSWETERVDRYNRFRWVVIDRLGARPSDVALDDVNRFSPARRRERAAVRPVEAVRSRGRRPDRQRRRR